MYMVTLLLTVTVARNGFVIIIEARKRYAKHMYKMYTRIRLQIYNREAIVRRADTVLSSVEH